MDREVDIRARILWGEDREEIRTDWLRKGAPAADVDAELRVAVQERRLHFRTRGFQDLLIALLLFALAAGAVGIYRAERQHQIVLHHKARGGVFSLMILLPLGGSLLACRGFRRLLIGGDRNEAASDLSEIE